MLAPVSIHLQVPDSAKGGAQEVMPPVELSNGPTGRFLRWGLAVVVASLVLLFAASARADVTTDPSTAGTAGDTPSATPAASDPGTTPAATDPAPVATDSTPPPADPATPATPDTTTADGGGAGATTPAPVTPDP